MAQPLAHPLVLDLIVLPPVLQRDTQVPEGQDPEVHSLLTLVESQLVLIPQILELMMYQ